jgi:hypothetical protein
MTYESISAVSDSGLARFGLLIIRAVQPSAPCRKSADCVPWQRRTASPAGASPRRQRSGPGRGGAKRGDRPELSTATGGAGPSNADRRILALPHSR